MNCDKFHLTPAIAKLQGIFYMQNGMCFRQLSIKAGTVKIYAGTVKIYAQNCLQARLSKVSRQ